MALKNQNQLRYLLKSPNQAHQNSKLTGYLSEISDLKFKDYKQIMYFRSSIYIRYEGPRF